MDIEIYLYRYCFNKFELFLEILGDGNSLKILETFKADYNRQKLFRQESNKEKLLKHLNILAVTPLCLVVFHII